MRRSDREITDREALIAVMRQCDVCRLALNDEETGVPYILPLNFGLAVENGKVVLYFHGATEGKKYALIAKDCRAAFEMDCGHRLVTDEKKGSCTMEYKSVIGYGRLEMVPEEEKYEALCILMRQYHKEDFAFNLEVMKQTRVFRLIVEGFTGKMRMVKEQ